MDEARLQETLERVTAQMRAAEERGAPADYIPELAKAPMGGFAIAVALADGRIVSAGDVEARFTIQSISKIFTLALALGRLGDQLWRRVGREPSGDPFNSGILLEQEDGRPRNPFINAGAIVTTDTVLSGRAPRDALAEILTFVRGLAEDQDIHIDKAVARSEREHGFRNFALAYLLKEAGNLENPVDLVLGTYFHHCAIDMTTPQLAAAGRFLIEGKSLAPLLSSVRVRSINALMMTCGQYDGSGEFAFRVGLPAKSGVGGGILAVAPRRASIAVWSPGLNRYGNSLLGTRAIELVAAEFGWSVF